MSDSVTEIYEKYHKLVEDYIDENGRDEFIEEELRKMKDLIDVMD